MRHISSLTPIYIFSSLQTGSGKATLLTNLAVYINSLNLKTAIIDFDSRKVGSIISTFPDSVKINKYSELAELTSITSSRFQNTLSFTETNLISYFPASSSRINELFNDASKINFLLHLRTEFDAILINMPSGETYSHQAAKTASETYKSKYSVQPLSILVSMSDTESIVAMDKLLRDESLFPSNSEEYTLIVFNRQKREGTEDNDLTTSEIRNLFNKHLTYVLPQNAEFQKQNAEPFPFVSRENSLTRQIITSLYRLMTHSSFSSLRALLQRESPFTECSSDDAFDLFHKSEAKIKNAIFSQLFMLPANYRIFIEETDRSYAVRVRLSPSTSLYQGIYDDKLQFERNVDSKQCDEVNFVHTKFVKAVKYSFIPFDKCRKSGKFKIDRIYSFDDSGFTTPQLVINQNLVCMLKKNSFNSPLIFKQKYYVKDVPSLVYMLGFDKGQHRKFTPPEFHQKALKAPNEGYIVFFIPTELPHCFTMKAIFPDTYRQEPITNRVEHPEFINFRPLPTRIFAKHGAEHIIPLAFDFMEDRMETIYESKIKPVEFSHNKSALRTQKAKFLPRYSIIALFKEFYIERQFKDELPVSSTILSASLLFINTFKYDCLSSLGSFLMGRGRREPFFPSRLNCPCSAYYEEFKPTSRTTSLKMLLNPYNPEMPKQRVIRRPELIKKSVLINIEGSHPENIPHYNIITSSCVPSAFTDKISELRGLMVSSTINDKTNFKSHKDVILPSQLNISPKLLSLVYDFQNKYGQLDYKYVFSPSEKTIEIAFGWDNTYEFSEYPEQTPSVHEYFHNEYLPIKDFDKLIWFKDLNNKDFSNLLCSSQKSYTEFAVKEPPSSITYIEPKESTVLIKDVNCPESMKIRKQSMMYIKSILQQPEFPCPVMPVLANSLKHIGCIRTYSYDYGEHRIFPDFILKDISKDIKKVRPEVDPQYSPFFKANIAFITTMIPRRLPPVKLPRESLLEPSEKIPVIYSQLPEPQLNEDNLTSTSSIIGSFSINSPKWSGKFIDTKSPDISFNYPMRKRLIKVDLTLGDKRKSMNLKDVSCEELMSRAFLRLSKKSKCLDLKELNFINFDIQNIPNNKMCHLQHAAEKMTLCIPDRKLVCSTPTIYDILFSACRSDAISYFSKISYGKALSKLKPLSVKQNVFSFQSIAQSNDELFENRAFIKTSMSSDINRRRKYEIAKLKARDLISWVRSTGNTIQRIQEKNSSDITK